MLIFHWNSVGTREKQKAENKDWKVLEILQAKDYRIQELEQVLCEFFYASVWNQLEPSRCIDVHVVC